MVLNLRYLKKTINYTFKLLASLILMLLVPAHASDKTFVSTSPSMTEIMYELGAQDMLKAVSTHCTYPIDARKKPVIGDAYFVDTEMLAKIKPDYFLAPDSAEFMLSNFKRFGVIPLCFKYKDINSIYNNILELGKLTNREEKAKKIVSDLKEKIAKANKHQNKRILYIIQTDPIMTPAKQSFINDVIEKSGNVLITGKINSYYPAVSEEYLISQKPDIIVLDNHCRESARLRKIFPNIKIIQMTEEESDIIDRPGPRIWKSVEFFVNLPY